MVKATMNGKIHHNAQDIHCATVSVEEILVIYSTLPPILLQTGINLLGSYLQQKMLQLAPSSINQTNAKRRAHPAV